MPRIFSLPILALVLAGCLATGIEEAETTGGYAARQELLLQQVAERYKPVEYDDRGKYSFPVVIARMDRNGTGDSRSMGYLEEYAGGKYGFFHFPFIGLARICGLYPEAPAVAKYREQFLREILFHDPKFHYNALTGEGTENHVNMSRTSGWLFAQEAMRYPALAARAEEWKARLKPWLLQWAKRVYQYGTGEWDSNVYTAYNLIGWLNLYDFAQDQEIRLAARAVLDYYAANIALKYTQGLYSGPESRGPTHYGTLPRTATEYLGWFWFGPDDPELPGGFFRGSDYIQSVHAATSQYRPPAALVKLARKEIPTPAMYRLSKPDYLMTRAGQSQETYLIEDSFTVGTILAPLGGWANSAYGIVNWKAVLKNPAGQPAVVWGNGGMRSTSGARGRNPFDQFAQAGNVIMQMTCVPADAEQLADQIAGQIREWQARQAADFKARWGRPHREHPGPVGGIGRGNMEDASKSLVYFPEDALVEKADGVIFISCRQTFLALRPLNGNHLQVQAGVALNDAPRGRISGFVIELANDSDFESFDTFRQACLEKTKLRQDDEDVMKFHYTDMAGNRITFTYSTGGSWEEMLVDWGYGIRELQIGFNSTRWKQPDWPEGAGQGRIPEVMVNGDKVVPLAPGTLIKGPQLQLENGILRILKEGDSQYTVNFQGPHPTFSQPPHGRTN